MIEAIKSLRWVDYFFFSLVDPARLAGMIAKEEKKPFPLSFAVVLFVSFVEILTHSLLGRETRFFYDKMTYGWILAFLILSLEAVILASLLDISCQFRGLPGNAKNMINLVNFSLFPRVFFLPLVYIFKVLHFAPVFFYAFFSVGFAAWSAFIIIRGIAEMHSLDFLRSAVIFLLPFVFVGAILFFSLILIVINFAGYLSVM